MNTLRKELLPKEKLFIFNVLENIRQNVDRPHYTDEFADDGITEEEFNDMANNNGKMRFFLKRHLTNCGIRWRHVEQELEMIKSINEAVKKDILPLLYNDNEEIPEHFKGIQPVIVEMLDKHFNEKELTESDHDKLWFTDAGDADALLAVEAFFEFQEGKRDILFPDSRGSTGLKRDRCEGPSSPDSSFWLN